MAYGEWCDQGFSQMKTCLDPRAAVEGIHAFTSRISLSTSFLVSMTYVKKYIGRNRASRMTSTNVRPSPERVHGMGFNFPQVPVPKFENYSHKSEKYIIRTRSVETKRTSKGTLLDGSKSHGPHSFTSKIVSPQWAIQVYRTCPQANHNLGGS